MAADGAEGLRLLYEHRPDLVVLDIMMPDRSGWDVSAQIRELSSVPIIMLTSLTEEDNTVRALEEGAVDYVTKPFSARVLRARARAALRRAEPQPGSARRPAYRDSYLIVDLLERRVLADGIPVHLTKTEYELLAMLVRNQRLVLTFSQILVEVWGPGYEENADYVHAYISRLRRKLEPIPETPRYLPSEHGVGYRFQPVQ